MEDWRRIDIDAFDKDSHIQPEELVPECQPVSAQEVATLQQNINSLVSKGSFSDAISLVTSNPMYGAEPQSKSQLLGAVVDLLSMVKQSEISTIVKSLSSEQQNVLIKYLYSGMSSSKGQKQGGVLLAWYDKTVEVTGLGPVVRYLSDRRQV